VLAPKMGASSAACPRRKTGLAPRCLSRFPPIAERGQPASGSPPLFRADALADDRLTMAIGRGMISVRNGDESHPNAGHSVEIGFLVASYADRKPNMGSYRGNNIRRSWDGTNERNQQSRGGR
jgi:hypothetical protein